MNAHIASMLVDDVNYEGFDLKISGDPRSYYDLGSESENSDNVVGFDDTNICSCSSDSDTSSCLLGYPQSGH